MTYCGQCLCWYEPVYERLIHDAALAHVQRTLDHLTSRNVLPPQLREKVAQYITLRATQIDQYE